MKILHITTDNKFIGHAMQSFEDVYPGKNEVWVFSNSTKLSLSINDCKKVSFFQIINPFLPAKFKSYDLVVLHSFHNYWIPLVFFAEKQTRFAWLGWGFDYYDYIYKKPDMLLLDDTKKLSVICTKKKLLKRAIETSIIWLLTKLLKSSALKKIKSFSPVLREDYELLEKAGVIPFLPPFVSWNYGSLEGNLVKNFIGERVHGDSVLVGNSASFTNNHIEVLKMLSSLDVFNSSDRCVVVPVSYGDECYKNQVLEQGRMLLGDSFDPMLDFMPMDDYVAKIKQCGFVIMNHIRQEAVGNILIMIYLGARVFLRKENPTYHFFKSQGVILNSISELMESPELLQQPLIDDEVETNIKIIKKHWSKTVIDKKTRDLVSYHLGKNA